MLRVRAAVFLACAALSAAQGGARKIHVLCWSERTEPASVYPNGINGALVEMFSHDKEIVASIANLYDPEQGLSDAALAKTDVLIWFGHQKHGDVTPEHISQVVKRVREGMGFLPLHSSHYSHPFQEILKEIARQKGAPLEGMPGSWGNVTNGGQPEHIFVLQPQHPIVKGVKNFTIPKTETYANPFNAPAPDLKILEGRYDGGPQDGNDGLLWKFGQGWMFYFRPGHETYPIFYQPEVRRILRNAVHFLASVPS